MRKAGIHTAGNLLFIVLKDFSHQSETWVTNSQELSIRNKKTKFATAKLQFPGTSGLAGILQVHGQHFTIVNFGCQHIPASPRARITPALWTKQAGTGNLAGKVSHSQTPGSSPHDKDRQWLEEILWRGPQHVHPCNKCLQEMRCAILQGPFPGEKSGEERPHYSKTGALLLKTTENFSLLLENISQLKH